MFDVTAWVKSKILGETQLNTSLFQPYEQCRIIIGITKQQHSLQVPYSKISEEKFQSGTLQSMHPTK